MSTFIRIIKPTNIYYYVKSYQNLTSSFQLISNFLIQTHINRCCYK